MALVVAMTLASLALAHGAAPPELARRVILAPCLAAAPAAGQRIAGTVLQVIDGRTVCVARGPSPSEWTRIEIADAPEPTAREALLAATFGRELECMVTRVSAGGAQAICQLDRVSVGVLAGSPAVLQQAKSWR